MMLVFLWTDILLWFLLLCFFVYFYKSKGKADFRSAVKQLASSKVAVASGVILLIYLTIGLLDSVHYREAVYTKIQHDSISIDHNSKDHKNISNKYYGDVKSILDYFLLPWSAEGQTEVTFSAPFSDSLFVKDKVALADGSIILDYPKLKHIQHRDSTLLILSNIILIILLNILFIYLLNYIIKRYISKDYFYNVFVYKTFYLVLFISLLLISVTYYTYEHFHILGTDKIGQDILYVSIKSIRTGLVIGLLTTIFMLPLAIMFGTAAGYFGGRIDDVVQYIYTTLSSIPGVLLIAALVLILQTQIALHPNWFETIAEQADVRLLALCIILGLTSWSGLCRLIRAETLKIKQLDYIQAAKSMKISSFRIIIKHVIPNLKHIVIINLAISFSGLVLAEAVLSYIGVGVDPSTMSWGNMINSARTELSREPVIWWNITAAFMFMSTFVLALNLLADKIRDAFDPKIRLQ